MLVPADRPKLWLLLGAFAFMGLFAMHGLNGHGITHAGGTQHHQQAAVGQTDHGAAGHVGAKDGSPPCDGTCAASESHAASPSPIGEDSDMVMALCVAVLMLAGIFAGLGLKRLALSTVGPPCLLPRVMVARARRDHDPPSIFRLSVQRC